MAHRFSVKELAQQSGLSTATVDRVINERPNVSPQSKSRVAAAMEELTLQEGQLAARGRRMFIDILVEAPARFSDRIKAAASDVLPQFRPAVIRPRFTLQEVMSEVETTQHIERIIMRGSSGVCLKARDLPAIRMMVERLREKNIPVVTMFTDIAADRLAYVGTNNFQAGQTAAYLMMQTIGGLGGAILMMQSKDSFAGEEARADGFRTAIAGQGFRLINISGGAGLAMSTAAQIADRASGIGQVSGVYSMGGGNRAIHDALTVAGMQPRVFVGHDLDDENKSLLHEGKLTFVIDHDLRQDFVSAFEHISHFHGLGPAPVVRQSQVQVVTPFQIA